MVSLGFYVGIAGNIISVLLFLSPAGTFKRILKKRSTEEFESFPYICTLLSSSLWTYYGIMRPGSILVATINGFGILVEIAYISIFLIYAPPTIRLKTMTRVGILNLGVPISAILATRLALDAEMRIDAIGFVCAGLNIIMYGSPLTAMKRVVTTRSVEYMPFWLSFFVFLNSGIWTLYAVIVKDWFLLVPNGTGFILGIVQLVLYAIYKRSKSSTRTNPDDVAQRESLISSSDQLIEPIEIRMES